MLTDKEVVFAVAVFFIFKFIVFIFRSSYVVFVYVLSNEALPFILILVFVVFLFLLFTPPLSSLLEFVKLHNPVDFQVK